MPQTTTTAFRHAQWDTPWWVNPNRNAGRYNDRGDEPTQYLCLHPLGVVAEFLRHLGPEAAEHLEETSLRLWAARVLLDDVAVVTFDNAPTFGLAADALVDDDYGPTQDLARRLRRAGAPGLRVPSAALPGTEVLVLFGARLGHPFAGEPVDARQQIPTTHVLDGPALAEVLPLLRRFGQPHSGLAQWRDTGQVPTLREPSVRRI